MSRRTTDTGYRRQSYDLEVPDRLPHEPHNIRVQAHESGPNRWTIRAHHGPHEEKDESGSYYKGVGETQEFTGPAGKVKSMIMRRGHDEFRGLIKRRS